jgi:hypothetical protein
MNEAGGGSPCRVTHRPSGASEETVIAPVTYRRPAPLGTLRDHLGYRLISRPFRCEFRSIEERYLYLAVLFIAYKNYQEVWNILLSLCGIS